jgi:hypothetical protein
MSLTIESGTHDPSRRRQGCPVCTENVGSVSRERRSWARLEIRPEVELQEDEVDAGLDGRCIVVLVGSCGVRS